MKENITDNGRVARPETRETHRYGVIVSFLLMLALFGLGAIGALRDDAQISEKENRALAKKPALTAESYVSGAFFRTWNDYLADHVPYRAEMLGVAETIKASRGLKRDVKLIEVTADMGVNAGAGENAESDAESAPAEPAPKQSLIVLPDRLLEVYFHDAQACAYYAETVNRYAARLPDTIRMYSMLIPMRIEFEAEEHRKVSDSQEAAIAQIYGALDPRIERVDAYAQLKAHKDEYIYFRTDHHWTALGAYYGLLAFGDAAGFDALRKDAYKENLQPGFLGALYKMAPNASLKNNADVLAYYTGKSNNKDALVYYYTEDGAFQAFNGPLLNKSAFKDVSYGIFLGGDYPLIAFDGDAKNGRVLAVIKDSYGNAFSTWLPPYFEKILVFDPRTFREGFLETMEKNGVTDLLILDYMKVTMLPAYVEAMNEMLDTAGAGI
jgi:hypothetical protein